LVDFEDNPRPSGRYQIAQGSKFHAAGTVQNEMHDAMSVGLG
jgi:hypothetical protein